MRRNVLLGLHSGARAAQAPPRKAAPKKAAAQAKAAAAQSLPRLPIIQKSALTSRRLKLISGICWLGVPPSK